MEETKILEIINTTLENKKAKDILNIDIRNKSIIADYLVVCTGTSTTHIKALADEIEEELEKQGILKHHIEGYSTARWILLDYSSIIINIFHQEEREYYDIEKLWEVISVK